MCTDVIKISYDNCCKIDPANTGMTKLLTNGLNILKHECYLDSNGNTYEFVICEGSIINNINKINNKLAIAHKFLG